MNPTQVSLSDIEIGVFGTTPRNGGIGPVGAKLGYGRQKRQNGPQENGEAGGEDFWNWGQHHLVPGVVLSV